MQQDNSSIKVMILAAGLGARLRPLTATMPKVMVPLPNGKPLLEHSITLLRDQGFRDFIINLHYLSEQVKSYFGDGSRFGVHIVYSEELGRPLETAGAIKNVAEQLTDPFLLVYGDYVHFFDFRPLVAAHRANKAIATIVLKRSGHPQEGDITEIDPKTNLVTACHARPHAIMEYGANAHLNAGFYVLSKEVLSHISPRTPVKLDIEILPKLVCMGLPIFGFPTDEQILDVGTPAQYEAAKEWYRGQKQFHVVDRIST